MNLRKEYFYRYSGPEFRLKLTPFFQDFHKLTMDGEYEYPQHTHNNYELIIVNDSLYYCSLNNSELTVHPGEFLLIKPGDTHQDHLYDSQFHYVLHFLLNSDVHGKRSEVKIFDDNILPEHQVGKCSKEISITFLKQLEEELNLSDLFSSYIQDAILESLFWKLLRSLDTGVLSESLLGLAQTKKFQLELYSIFEQYCNRNIGVNEIARLMGMSKRSLSNFCDKFVGLSPARALIKYKLDKADELLSNSSLPIKAIGDKLGFDNPFHFSRVFKRYFGVSPKNHRINKQL